MNNVTLRSALESIIETAREVSSDLGAEVEEVVREGLARPLDTAQARRLLARIVEVVDGRAAEVISDSDTAALRRDLQRLDSDVGAGRDTPRPPAVTLESREGLGGPVTPTPVFHGRKIPMNEGIVKTLDIPLWDHNERLEIHLEQFRQANGRGPTSDEVLDLMLSRMQLPGALDDEFEIRKLANSIAVSGVRVAPILARDGTLLDGNRRVAACCLILSSDEFTPEQKSRVRDLYVWQLSEHATADDEEAVVVSLNFEPDGKLPWPEYVKARKIHEEWQRVLALEPRTPGSKRLAELKRSLAVKFAYGSDTGVVNRYLKMVDLATEFEDYHVNSRERDMYEVRHRAGEYFQYFDELAKGASPGGVAHTLGQSEALKQLVFDLLFQGKFKNWRLIRSLRYVPENPEYQAKLAEIRDRNTTTPDDLEQAQDDVEEVLGACVGKRAESRQLGADARIASFVRFLEGLPVGAFRDELSDKSLTDLLRALELVRPEVESILALRSEQS
ncbi:MAG: hypothetical protein HMLKMBBP_00097 [Planctomycetes bacterium]|nr:hypothetical protein [Planctomycetota bacterium]